MTNNDSLTIINPHPRVTATMLPWSPPAIEESNPEFDEILAAISRLDAFPLDGREMIEETIRAAFPTAR